MSNQIDNASVEPAKLWIVVLGLPLLLIMLVLIHGWAWHSSWQVDEPGPVTSREEWPRPLRSLLDNVNGIEVDESTIQVYCLYRGFDPEYLWRVDAAPGLFELIESRWRLTQVAEPKWFLAEGYRDPKRGPPPDWWQPRNDSNTTYFVSPPVLASSDGDWLLVARDDERKVIWVYFMDVF